MLGVREPKSHFASILIFSLFAATWVIAAVITLRQSRRVETRSITTAEVLYPNCLTVSQNATKTRNNKFGLG